MRPDTHIGATKAMLPLKSALYYTAAVTMSRYFVLNLRMLRTNTGRYKPNFHQERKCTKCKKHLEIEGVH